MKCVAGTFSDNNLSSYNTNTLLEKKKKLCRSAVLIWNKLDGF